MIGVVTAITKKSPVTDHARKPSDELRSSAMVGSDAETMVIDDVNTTTVVTTVIRTRFA